MMAVLYRAPVARSFFAQLKTGTQLPAAVTRIVTNRHRTEAEAQQSQGRKSIEWSRLFQPTQLTTFDPPWPISKRWDPSTVPRGTVFFILHSQITEWEALVRKVARRHQGREGRLETSRLTWPRDLGAAKPRLLKAEATRRSPEGARAVRVAGRESRSRGYGRPAGSPDRCRNVLRRYRSPGRRPRNRLQD